MTPTGRDAGGRPSGLVWSDTIADEAEAIHRDVQSRLADLAVPGTLELTGAASVRGVLTKGDVDLHLRVGTRDFLPAVERLATAFRSARADAWSSTLAVFEIPGHRSTGLAVTPVDSEHDRRFRRAWKRLGDEPALLAEYNEMKRTRFGDPDYEHLKSAFFTRITTD